MRAVTMKLARGMLDVSRDTVRRYLRGEGLVCGSSSNRSSERMAAAVSEGMNSGRTYDN